MYSHSICHSFYVREIHRVIYSKEWGWLARLNGPSSLGLYGPLVARIAAKQQTHVFPLGQYTIFTNTRPVYDLST